MHFGNVPFNFKTFLRFKPHFLQWGFYCVHNYIKLFVLMFLFILFINCKWWNCEERQNDYQNHIGQQIRIFPAREFEQVER